MSGGCQFDGCGKDAPKSIRSELGGAEVAYCAKHAQMAADGFRHVVTSSLVDRISRGGMEDRWYWLGKVMIREDGRAER